MADPLAHYAFIPWLRTGIANQIEEEDAQGSPTSGMAEVRAELSVNLTLESEDVGGGPNIETTVNKTVKVMGPPDVMAISPQAIVRNEPKSKVNNYESNGLPYIEFYEEDFLWRYTPARSGSGGDEGKLTPWLALICLKDDEFELKATSEGRAYISIPTDKAVEVFHDPRQHWAWGHVHMNTELVATSLSGQINEVVSELDENPDAGVCRLLCPRKLIKETQYTAFLIPAYETGRLAVLGEDYTGVLAQEIAWGRTEADFTSRARGTDFPVYFNWTFRTGLYGDFESLARILEPVVTDPELGKRDMFIADAGYGLKDTPPNSQVLGLEGALKPPDFVADKWANGSGDRAYREHLRKLLNLSIDHEKQQTDDAAVVVDSLQQNPFYSASLGDDPILTPHVYGRWHALVNRLRARGGNPAWVNTLNLDPRNRAAAGLGTTVVQKKQEDYMRRAWKQVEEINEANAKIKKANVSKLISQALFQKHIRPAGTDQTVGLTSAMHSQLKGGAKTVQHTLTNSLIPNASKSGAFRKVTRPGKKTNKKINAFASPGANLIQTTPIQNFNKEEDTAGSVTTAKLKKAPLLAINFAEVGSAITSSITSYASSDTAMAQQAIFDALQEETSFANLQRTANKNRLKNRIDNLPDPNPPTTVFSSGAKQLAKDLVDGILSSEDGGEESSHAIEIEEAPFKAVFGEEITAKTYLNIILNRDTDGQPGVLGRATLLQDITAYGTAFTGFNDDIISGMVPVTKADPIPNLINFSTQINEALAPKDLVMNRVLSGITLTVFNPQTQTYDKEEIDKLRPIMAYPKFDDPMFRELKELSQEYILPNIDKVPENSITLLETNQQFIEAYMAGLNHEMSRELLWREFPTDQRGTYFRQFWDVSDNILETDPEKKYDITEMHTWKQQLGAHSPRVITNPSGSTYLVLLIRGELLKKYPNTQVYAQKASFKDTSNPDTPRNLADESNPDNIQLPVFMAELDPDIYLFGFDLGVDEAKGDSSDSSKPGWFFALRERPGQIRFGLDDWTPANPDDPDFPTEDPTNWNDLSWEHLVNSADELQAYQIDALHGFSSQSGTENSPLAVWGKNAADMAYILYQNPVLFARHAQEMLPD